MQSMFQAIYITMFIEDQYDFNSRRDWPTTAIPDAPWVVLIQFTSCGLIFTLQSSGKVISSTKKISLNNLNVFKCILDLPASNVGNTWRIYKRRINQFTLSMYCCICPDKWCGTLRIWTLFETSQVWVISSGKLYLNNLGKKLTLLGENKKLSSTRPWRGCQQAKKMTTICLYGHRTENHSSIISLILSSYLAKNRILKQGFITGILGWE